MKTCYFLVKHANNIFTHEFFSHFIVKLEQLSDMTKFMERSNKMEFLTITTTPNNKSTTFIRFREAFFHYVFLLKKCWHCRSNSACICDPVPPKSNKLWHRMQGVGMSCQNIPTKQTKIQMEPKCGSFYNSLWFPSFHFINKQRIGSVGGWVVGY